MQIKYCRAWVDVVSFDIWEARGCSQGGFFLSCWEAWVGSGGSEDHWVFDHGDRSLGGLVFSVGRTADHWKDRVPHILLPDRPGGRTYHGSEKYLDRLGSCAILSELPYDLAFYGGICDDRCNVMVTLFIGAAVLAVLQSDRAEWLKVVTLLVGALVARWLGADYGALGVLMIVLFSFELPVWVDLVLLGLVFFFSGSATVVVFQWVIPIQMFGLLALVPIAFYQEEKRWYAPWIKWGFYLFYPVHLLVLLVVRGTMMA